MARRSLLLLFLLGCRAPAAPIPAPPPRVVAPAIAEEMPADGRLPRDTVPRRYRLALTMDPAAGEYAGSVEIDLELAAPRRTLWLHGSPAQRIDRARVGVASAVWKLEDAEGLASLTLPTTVGPGAVTVRIDFSAPYEPRQHGLFRVESRGDWYAFTKFEPQSARIAFPCLDEPALKATFALTLTVPDGLVAVGNTPVVGDTPLGKERRWTFAETALLPTYLFAWAVGPFDVVARELPPSAQRPQPLPVRGIAARGRGPQLAYALATVPPVLAELESYFGIAYPWAKLDLIAAPEYPSTAMENAGLLSFRESALLVDERASSQEHRWRVAGVIAHEIAHEWFGNLVTMAWWDDLWLNEAFAEWMGIRVLDRVLPESRAGLTEAASIFDVMAEDALPSARAIRQPVRTSHDTRNAFDSLTYTKGLGLLIMAEAWLGEAVFRDGVRRHLAARRLGNASAADLFAALGDAAGQDVGAVLGTFVGQSGVPSLALACAGGALVVTTTPFTPARATVVERRWQVPLCVRGEGGRACALVGGEAAQLPVPGGRCGGWVHPNAGGTGYYRFTLGAAELNALAGAWDRLDARERLALADSVHGAFLAGNLGLAELAPWLARFAAEPDRVLLGRVASIATTIGEHMLAPGDRPRLEGWLRRLLLPRLARIGVKPRPREALETTLLRVDLIVLLARQAREPKLRRMLAAQGRAWVTGRGQKPSPEMLGPALRVFVEDGGVADWDALRARLAQAQGDERKAVLEALAAPVDPGRHEAAFALALDPEVRGIEPLTILRSSMTQPATRPAAWRWVEAHLDELAARLPAQQQRQLVALPEKLCSAPIAAELERALAPRVQAFPGGPRTLARTAELLRQCEALVAVQAAPARAFLAAEKVR